LMMGLFLLDVFQVPNLRIFSRLQEKSANRKGLAGAFMVGGVSGLIVAPCTGPILAVALGAIALTLKTVYGAEYALQVMKGGVLLFLFGLGQGALILIAGTFAGFLYRLPRAGEWMATVKKGFALLIILTASLLFVFVGQNTDFPNLTRLLAGSYSSAPQSPQEPKLAAATALPPRATEKSSEAKAPDFTLTALDGSHTTLSSFKGKKGVVLVFFATWCVNCMKEVPEIKKFALTAQKENIEVLAINFKQSAYVVEKFHKSNSINYRILLDTDGAVTIGKYGIKGIPHIVGIDAKGEMIYRGEDLPVKKTEFMERLNRGL
jgi:thiol:disulfide interchange protein